MQIFKRYGRKCQQIAFKCTDCNSSYACKCVCWANLCVFIKILLSSLNTMLLVDKHSSDVCCDEFPQIDRKSKEVKEQWHGKFYLHSIWEKFAILNTENIKICGWITKLEAIKTKYCAFQQCKKFENRLRFDKVTESLKVGTFLRHSVLVCDKEWTNFLFHCACYYYYTTTTTTTLSLTCHIMSATSDESQARTYSHVVTSRESSSRF